MNETTPEEQNKNLPKGWALTTLTNVSNFINGFAFKSDDYQFEGARSLQGDKN